VYVYICIDMSMVTWPMWVSWLLIAISVLLAQPPLSDQIRPSHLLKEKSCVSIQRTQYPVTYLGHDKFFIFGVRGCHLYPSVYFSWIRCNGYILCIRWFPFLLLDWSYYCNNWSYYFNKKGSKPISYSMFSFFLLFS
jgi:hypothetical protein